MQHLMKLVSGRLGLTLLIVICFSCGNKSAPTGKSSTTTDSRIKVKVALVIQDPRIPSQGNKRLHEIFKTPGYTFTWHDPYKLARDYRDTLFSVSHGTVDYQIVKTIDDDKFFTRLRSTNEMLSFDRVIELLGEPGWKTFKDAGTKFDYNAFIDHYGFCGMRDKGEIDEVWLWTFPYGGTWESTFAGENAFWLNSYPVQESSCKNLLTIMGLNYEREMSLALESYGHRFESVMRHVYGRWDNQSQVKNNWEFFTSYDKINPGNANIGNIHFPPNGQADYDWTNKLVVNTFADSWSHYPNLKFVNPRQVDCREWNCSHLGYMTWWYRHIPHFAGLNKSDGHLNNWWRYVVDYTAAMKYESELKAK